MYSFLVPTGKWERCLPFKRNWFHQLILWWVWTMKKADREWSRKREKLHLNIDYLHITWCLWKPVQLGGHLDCSHFDTSGSLKQYMLIDHALSFDMIPSDPEVYQHVINQGGHPYPIVLVSMGTTLCETRLYSQLPIDQARFGRPCARTSGQRFVRCLTKMWISCCVFQSSCVCTSAFSSQSTSARSWQACRLRRVWLFEIETKYVKHPRSCR